MADEAPRYAPIEVYLTVDGGEAAIEFYQKAFGAVETYRMMAEDGKRVMHCNLSMFGGQIMLSDEFHEYGADTASPSTRDGASVTVHINLADAAAVDAVMARAAEAGAKVTMPAADMFWGSHYGRLLDPFGHAWSFGSPPTMETR
jgi:PhnB protein